MINFRESYIEKIASYNSLKNSRDSRFLEALNSIQRNIEYDFSKYLHILDLVKEEVYIENYLSLKISGTRFTVLFFDSYLSKKYSNHKRKRNIVFFDSRYYFYSEINQILQIAKFDDFTEQFKELIDNSNELDVIPSVFSQDTLKHMSNYQTNFCSSFILEYETIKKEIDSFFENILKEKITELNDEITVFDNFSSANKPVETIKM